MGLFTLLNVAAGQVQPGDMSFITLFHQAHLVVKVVMIGLIFSSIWAWGIVFEKMFAFRRAKKLSDQFERQFWAGEPFKDLYARCLQNQPQAMSAVFVAAMREWERSQETGAKASEALKMRLAKVMDLAVVRETDKLERRLLFLATIGSTAPFIGLFGTVWGIMTSFQAIAASKNTSLAVVAPGIAEALFATALGLLAAIPAVIFYNKFSSDLGRVGQRLEGFADEFSTILSRQMEASK